MAAASQSIALDPKKRKKPHCSVKLPPGENVEVFSLDEGLAGSWHPAVVISHGKGFRQIEYSYLHTDGDGKSKLVEWISVGNKIVGECGSGSNPKYSSCIRPAPPLCDVHASEFTFGLCVDAWVSDMWWEGVVFDDIEGSVERKIFFPELGDQSMVHVDHLRVTLNWDEVSGNWERRGIWFFAEVLKEIEEKIFLPVSMRQIWYDLRAKPSFQEKIGSWDLGPRTVWKKLVTATIRELRAVVGDHIHGNSQVIQAPMIHSSLKGTRDITKEENVSKIGKTKVVRKDPKASYCSWKTVKIEPELNSEAIRCFVSAAKGKKLLGSSYDDLRLKVRKHLVALGWKIEWKRDTLQRYQYSSPDGKVYHSLAPACSFILNKHQKEDPKIPSNSLVPESCLFSKTQFMKCVKLSRKRKRKFSLGTSEELHVEKLVAAENLPEAVGVYDKFMNCQNRKDRNENDKGGAKLLRENAKKHLLFMGWKIMTKQRKLKGVVCYVSPDGKTYYSLLTACKGYLEEYVGSTSGSHDSIYEGSQTPYSVSGVDDFGFCDLSSKESKKIEKQVPDLQEILSGKTSVLVPTQNQKLSKKKQTRVRVLGFNLLRCVSQSSKRSRPVSESNTVIRKSSPRTILSFLIEKDLVLPRQKVSYIRKKDGRVMMEGRITSKGIKCHCCNKMLSLTSFEAHSRSKSHRPSANIFLEDGRSLLQCQAELLCSRRSNELQHSKLKCDYSNSTNDGICSICQDGGSLVLCDYCPSSYHIDCVGLEAVPEGKWPCPCCVCGICGGSEYNSDVKQFTEKTIMYCDQCEREYHVGCLGSFDLKSCPTGDWFCSEKCSKIHLHLQNILGKPMPTSVEGFSWTILSSNSGFHGEEDDEAERVAEFHSKLHVALKILHECFVTMIEPRTQTDLIADILSVANNFCIFFLLNFCVFLGFLVTRLQKCLS